jgi:NMD protein affecting ribosome stability and mRNA decay
MSAKCIECGAVKPLAKFRTANVCKRCYRARKRIVAAMPATLPLNRGGEKNEGS